MLVRTLNLLPRRMYTNRLPPTQQEWVDLKNEVLTKMYWLPNYVPSPSAQKCLNFMIEEGIFSILDSYVSMFNKLIETY